VRQKLSAAPSAKSAQLGSLFAGAWFVEGTAKDEKSAGG